MPVIPEQLAVALSLDVLQFLARVLGTVELTVGTPDFEIAAPLALKAKAELVAALEAASEETTA